MYHIFLVISYSFMHNDAWNRNFDRLPKKISQTLQSCICLMICFRSLQTDFGTPYNWGKKSLSCSNGCMEANHWTRWRGERLMHMLTYREWKNIGVLFTSRPDAIFSCCKKTSSPYCSTDTWSGNSGLYFHYIEANCMLHTDINCLVSLWKNAIYHMFLLSHGTLLQQL